MNPLSIPGLALLAALLMPLPAAQAQDRSQGRSQVITRQGVVASEHTLASQAGATILARGGNAVDAAIAANAVMGVVAPMMCGIGGDLFALVYEAKTGQLHGLNASGWAPAALSLEVLRNAGYTTNMPQAGIHSITVPGTVEGWDKLRRKFGRKKFSELLAPAIQYAEEGFPVSEWVNLYWLNSEKTLRRQTNAARTFLPHDRAPGVGELFRNPDLAWSYKQIAARGRDAFYDGAIGERLVAFSQKAGGTLAAKDLKNFSAEWVEPISTTYRGWTVYEIPPGGQGIAALVMLNLMEKFPLAEYGHNSPRALHTMIEAKKLAYADMLKFVADPRFSKVNVRGMLSKSYAAERAKLIDQDKANCHVEAGQPPEHGGDTTYLSVVDSEGNMVSFIQSNYLGFGSGLVADGTGFALQNRGGLFSVEPSHPNVVAPWKRPLHTIIPAFMTKGEVKIAFGIMGGWNQSQAHAQFVSNIADYQMNIQAALEAPRFTKATFYGCDVKLEDRIPETTRQELAAKGHVVKVMGSYSSDMGGGQAVLRDFATGVNFGGSDPRKDGAAIPEPIGRK